MQHIEEKLKVIHLDIEGFAKEIDDGITISSEEENEKVAEYLGQIKKRRNRIEELRKEFVQPLNDQVKFINNKFKKEISPLDTLEKSLKNSMASYYIKKLEMHEKTISQDLEAIHKEIQDADTDEKKMELTIKRDNMIMESSFPDSTTRAGSTTVSVQRRWTYKVYDKEALIKAHPELFELDSKKAREFAQNVREERSEDGISIYQDVTLSVR